MGWSFEIDRRRFLKSSLLAAAAGWGCGDQGVSRGPATSRGESPAVIIRNATVHSIDPQITRANTIALGSGAGDHPGGRAEGMDA